LPHARAEIPGGHNRDYLFQRATAPGRHDFFLRQDSRLSVGSEILEAEGLSPQAGEVYVRLNPAAEVESSQTLVSIVGERVTKYLDRREAESCKPEMARIFEPDGNLAKSFNQSGK
jgi:hypothetical protein